MSHEFPSQETSLLPADGNDNAAAPLVRASETAMDTNMVMALLVRAKEKIRRRKYYFWIRMTLIPISLMLLGFAFIGLLDWGAPMTPMVAVLYLATALALIMGTVYHQAKWPYRDELEELVQVGCIHSIGLLLETLHAGTSGSERKALYAALSALLPQLKASDAHLLTPAHRSLLYTHLQCIPHVFGISESSLAYDLAILKALEQVGDKQALPIVKRLGFHPLWWTGSYAAIALCCC